MYIAAAANSLQSCPTLCNPIEGSPPGSPVPGILQARTQEWVAISLSNAWKWKVEVKSLSCVRLAATPWTAAYQAPPSMGFSRQEYWSGVPLPSLNMYITICETDRQSKLEAWNTALKSQCAGTTLRDGMGRKLGGGFRMRDTCTPMAGSCQCLAKTTTI